MKEGFIQRRLLEEVHVFVAGAGVHEDDVFGAGEEVLVD